MDPYFSSCGPTARIRRQGRRRSLAPVIAVLLTAGALVSARALAARIAREQAPVGAPAELGATGEVAPRPHALATPSPEPDVAAADAAAARRRPPPPGLGDAAARVEALLATIEKSTAYAVAGPPTRVCPALGGVPVVVAGTRDGVTSSTIRAAIARDGDGVERREVAARAVLDAPFVLVVTGLDRAWLLKRGGTWRGAFDGRVALVDTRTARPVCAASLSYESRSKIRSERIDDATMRSLRDELEARFPREAARALGGRVRLER